MSQLNRAIHLAGSTLDCSFHACAFFHSRDEEEQVLLPFVKEGIDAGEKILQLIDTDRRDDRRSSMALTGIDVAAAERAGQMQLVPWEETYLRGARFDQDSMLALVEDVLADGQRQGYECTRIWANMEWALKDLGGVDDIIEYEARANYLLPKYNDAVVCCYDVNRFSAAVVMNVLRTHPQVIIGGILQQNPFYVPPDRLLAELRDRKRA
jgi:hypothetical protein